MNKIILIKHAKPVINKSIDSSNWILDKFYECKIDELLFKIRYKPTVIYTSPEKKAIATAERISKIFNLSYSIESSIYEHNRRNSQYIETTEKFRSTIKKLLIEKDKKIYGNETANEALERFVAGIGNIKKNKTENTFVVSHGTVMSLFVEKYNNINAFDIWEKLTLPAAIIIDKDTNKIERIETVETNYWPIFDCLIEKLNANNVKFQIDASSSLYVQGVDIQMDDIDIIIQYDNYEKLFEIFNGNIIEEYGSNNMRNLKILFMNFPIHFMTNEYFSDLNKIEERRMITRNKENFYVKSIKFYRRHIDNDHLYAERIDRMLKENNDLRSGFRQ